MHRILFLFIAVAAMVHEFGHAAEPSRTPAMPPWKAMDYGPYFSATLQVLPGNIANKGIAIRLDSGEGGLARGRQFVLFDTDTLRMAGGWTGSEFIDWRNIAFTGEHEVHASIIGELAFANPDAPGWSGADGAFADKRVVGRDGQRYGPMPRSWGRWKGLYVHGNRVVLSYEVNGSAVLESASVEGQTFVRTLNVGPRQADLMVQVAHQTDSEPVLRRVSAAERMIEIGLFSAMDHRVPKKSDAPGPEQLKRTAVAAVCPGEGGGWLVKGEGHLRWRIPAGAEPVRVKFLYAPVSTAAELEQWAARIDNSPAEELTPLTRGGPRKWTEEFVTAPEVIGKDTSPYLLEQISLPIENTYRSWMRLGGFDFFAEARRAAVCTWQGDVWLVDGLGETPFQEFRWRRIATGLFQPLGLRIVDGQIYVTCRDQITRLRDLNGDGETDFYESFNHDAQVTPHFHEFAMDLQTDRDGNFYYAKAARHAKDWLVPQHGTLLKVAKDGSTTEIMARGFRAPNGVCVNPDGTLMTSDQEGHWIPANRIDWVEPGGFHGNMFGAHDLGRSSEDFARPMVWIHKSLDRSPAEQLWVTSDRWGPLKGALLSLSYGTGKILTVLHEKVGSVRQGGVLTLPIEETPTGIMRGRFHPSDGQLYVAGLFGWAGDKTRPGGFYRVRHSGRTVTVPNTLHATRRGMLVRFTAPLDFKSASDPQNYSVWRWEYKRTANYGSQDYKISRKGERGRDMVDVTGVRVSSDHKSVLIEIPDMQPCMQMEIRYNVNAADGTELEHVIQNTIHVVGENREL